MGKRPAVMQIDDPRQWKVLLSPVRYELVEAMRSMKEPCGIAEIASAVGRKPDVLYRHVAALEKAGFITSAGFRKAGRRIEQLFDLTADDFRPGLAGMTRGSRSGKKDTRDAIIATLRSTTKGLEKAVRDAANAGELDVRDKNPAFALFYELCRLDAQQLQDMMDHARAIKRLADDRSDGEDARLFGVHVVITPIVRKSGQRKTRPAKQENKS